MHIFYTPDIQSNIYTLNETESKHCVQVLRLQVGADIQLIDGAGGFYTAKITNNHPKRCSVEVIDKQQNVGKRPYYLHIALALTKQIERFEWFLEKATEIGIDEITPLLCEHSERKVVNNERLEKIIVSAVKQSMNGFMPKLNEMTKFQHVIKNNFEGNKFIAHCIESEKKTIKELINPQLKTLILVGPEGDFSPAEVVMAKQLNFSELSLGNSRLRTETAGIVACHSVGFMYL